MTKNLPPTPNRDNSLDAPQPNSSSHDGYQPTMPLDSTTGGEPYGETVSLAPTPPPGAAGAAGPSQTDFPATLNSAGGVMDTLDAVRNQVQRKASAVLRTNVGDYEIERELGRGGMGVVYKARHRQLRRDVALKMILSGRHAGPEQLERFLAEARAVAQLQHPNIVQIFDIGEHDGLPYFSLEYVDGQSLAQQLNKEPQTPEHAGSTVELLARAMQYAHDHGVLHRDLKPANVLMTKEGVPKITDFGLAKKVDDDEAASTRTGTVMGTPSYMSPEQALGLTHEVGPAADQYSLAAMLYEMLTGRPPFLAAKAVDTILQVINDEPIRPRQMQSTVPVDLETICLKGLQKEPSKRYASCFELAEDLRRFREGAPILARPVGSVERAWRWCRRNPRVATLAATVLALLIFVAVGSSAAAFTIWRAHAETERQRQDAVAARNLADEKAHAEAVAREAAESARKAAETAQKAADENAKVASGQAELALTTIQKLIYEVQKQLENAPGTQQLKRDLLQTAMDGLKKVAERAASSNSQEATMAAAHMKMGLIFKQLGETEEAFAQFMRCHDIVVKRMELKPNSDSAKGNVASSFTMLGEMSQELRRDMKTALDYYQKALQLRKDLYLHPRSGEGQLDPIKVKQGLAEAYTRVGVTILRLGNPRDAMSQFQEALKLRKELAEQFPSKPEYAQDLARSHNAVGEVQFRVGDLDGTRASYATCLELREDAFAKNPMNYKFKQELARSCGMLGEVHLRAGNHADARTLFDRSRELGLELVQVDEKNVEYQRDLGIAYYRCATLAKREADLEKSRSYFDACLKIREKLAQTDSANDLRRVELMLVLPHCGQHARASELAQQIQSSTRKDPEILFEVARSYAQCMEVSDPGELRQSYRQQAITAMRDSVEGGYRDIVSLRTEPDLDPLRQDAEFEAILKNLEAKSAAKQVL